MVASLVNEVAWLTRSNTFRKFTNTVCTLANLLPRSVALYQSCVTQARVVTLDLPWVKACWLFVILRSSLFRLSWNLSNTFAICGSTDICLKSLAISTGLLTFGTGLTKACLYNVEYLHCWIFAQIMSWMKEASSSLNCFRIQAGTPSDPVAFRGFSLLKGNFYLANVRHWWGTIKTTLSTRSSTCRAEGSWSFYGTIKASRRSSAVILT